MPVQIPDDADFSSFREQCVSAAGWRSRYSRGGVTVWDREEESREEDSRQEESRSVQRLKVSLLGGLGEEEESRQEERRSIQLLKMRIVCKDVTAETLYDVLHDTSYRKKWDSNMIDTYDIGRLTANADVGYYSWKCPSPLKNRDFVTMRSWLPLGNDYLIINYSVKHPQHPPKKDYVRAVSLLTGYLIQSNGASCSTLYYLTQMDPRGSLPKWVVNRASQFVAPKAMRKIYKASLKYPDWKRKHNPSLKPWMFPEQNTLPCISVSELNVQRADSLENIDESGLSEDKTHHSEDEET